jgi:predicted GIY-YIG superfamily endonuclease
VATPRRFVYLLQSESDPRRFYTGLTSNLRLRLAHIAPDFAVSRDSRKFFAIMHSDPDPSPLPGRVPARR